MPSHLLPDAKSCTEMPLESFFGEAIVLKFPGEHAIAPEDFRDVRTGDIVLLYCAEGGTWITPAAAQVMLDKRIKMLGVQGVAPDDVRAYDVGSTVPAVTHQLLLANDIPIIEGIANLEQVEKARVYYFGLPMLVRHLESSWIRAIAFEPRG
jgi:kynurenine formamidase